MMPDDLSPTRLPLGNPFINFTAEQLNALSAEEVDNFLFDFLCELTPETQKDLLSTPGDFLKKLAHAKNFFIPENYYFWELLTFQNLGPLLDLLVKENPKLMDKAAPFDPTSPENHEADRQIEALLKLPYILDQAVLKEKILFPKYYGQRLGDSHILFKALHPRSHRYLACAVPLLQRSQAVQDLVNFCLKKNPALAERIVDISPSKKQVFWYVIHIDAIRKSFTDAVLKKYRPESTIYHPSSIAYGDTDTFSSAFYASDSLSKNELLPLNVIRENLELMASLLNSKPEILEGMILSDVKYLLPTLRANCPLGAEGFPEYLDVLIEFPFIMEAITSRVRGRIPEDQMQYYASSKLGQCLLLNFSQNNPAILDTLQLDNENFAGFFKPQPRLGDLLTLAWWTPHIFNDIRITQDQLDILISDKNKYGMFFLDVLRRQGLTPFRPPVHFKPEYITFLETHDMPGMAPSGVKGWIENIIPSAVLALNRHELEAPFFLPPPTAPTARLIELHSPEKIISTPPLPGSAPIEVSPETRKL